MILASNYRIRDKERIEDVKRNGKLLQSEDFGMAYLKKDKEDRNPKFAFVISTKISKLAVNRNRINRAMHEGVRGVLSGVSNMFDYVFLAKKGIANKSTEEIIREVGSFLKDHSKLS